MDIKIYLNVVLKERKKELDYTFKKALRVKALEIKKSPISELNRVKQLNSSAQLKVHQLSKSMKNYNNYDNISLSLLQHVPEIWIPFRHSSIVWANHQTF